MDVELAFVLIDSEHCYTVGRIVSALYCHVGVLIEPYGIIGVLVHVHSCGNLIKSDVVGVEDVHSSIDRISVLWRKLGISMPSKPLLSKIS